MGAFVVVGVLKPLANDFSLSLSQAGYVLSFYALGYALSSPILAVLCGSWTRRKVLLVGLSLFLVSTLLASFTSSYTWLLTFRAFSAIGAAIFTPAAFSVAASSTQISKRGRALSIVGVGLTLAQIAGIPLGTYLGYAFGWKMAFICVVSLGIIALALCYRFIPTKIDHKPIRLKQLAYALVDPKLLHAILFTALLLTATYMVFTFMALLLESKLQLSQTDISLAFIVIGIGALIGNLIGGYATDRIGAIPSLVTAVSCQIIILPVLTLSNYSTLTGMILVFIWALISWSFMVPQQVRMVRIKPDSQSVNLALNASCIYLGTAVGASAGGLVLDHFGLEYIGPVAAGVIIVSMVLLFRSARMYRTNNNAKQ